MINYDNLPALEAELGKHNHAYTVLNEPTISDAEYDALKHRYIELYQKTHGHKPKRPVSLLGIVTDDHFAKKHHPIPMLSLVNCFSPEEVRNFFNGYTPLGYFIEPKFDGLSLELIYQDGKLESATTRGDGEIGEVVTPNAKVVGGVPLDVGGKGRLLVRGEVVMPFTNFEAVNNKRALEGEKAFANPRNAASGSLRQIDPRVTKERGLWFIPYSFRYLDTDKPFGDIKRLDQAGLMFLSKFPMYQTSRTATCGDLAELPGILERFKVWSKEQFPFATDGVVIKMIEFANQDLGNTSEGPRWACAFKYPEEEVMTTCRDIVYQTGRTGQVTPVVELNPVMCAGVEVTRATLHNFTRMVEHNPQPGKQVLIKRAGEVIPFVVKCFPDDGYKVEPITNCPSCGTELIRKGELTFCPNKVNCPSQLLSYFEHFVSRECFNIDQLGTETLQQLIEKGFVRKPTDLFGLTKEQLLALDLYSEVKAEKLINALKRSREGIARYRILYALGIPEVGEGIAKLLLDQFNGDLPAIAAAEREALEATEKVGEVISGEIYNFFREGGLERLQELLNLCSTDWEPKVTEGEFLGKTICITGRFTRPRNDIKAIFVAMGAKITGSVSKKTDYILIGEDAGSKKAAAEKLGITVLDPVKYIDA